ncbi:MAG: histidine kinase N-terminal 7TM domain-containing protein [Chloroflexales bacterium]
MGGICPQRRPYCIQAQIMLVASINILVMEVFWLLYLASGPSLSPFSLVIFGVLTAWALFRYQFLDLVPVSYHVLIATMRGPMSS